MKLKEIKKLTKDQLMKDLEKNKKDLFNLRFQKINGQITNSSKYREIKKTALRFPGLIFLKILVLFGNFIRFVSLFSTSFIF